MESQITIDGNQINVQLIGQMFDEDAADLRIRLLRYIEQGYIIVTLDMGGLDYIDSSGLAVLISLHKRINSLGGRIVITRLKGVVKELFTVTHLTTVFEIKQED